MLVVCPSQLPVETARSPVAGCSASLLGMSTHAIATTAEELLELPTGEGRRYELVAGRLLVMAPAGAEHGRVTSTANLLLSTHVHATGSGVTFGAETGFVLASDPDTVRAPDAAFVSQVHADAIGRTAKFWPAAPDFAVEVVSPGDSFSEVESKALSWLQAGATAILVLDPDSRAASVYRAGGEIRVLTDGEVDLSDAVPGWRVAVADFFA
jgi:Uma2 family endonuclease